MKRVDLFGSGIQSKSQVVTAQRRINVYTGVRPDSDKSATVFYGTPGLLLNQTVSGTYDGVIRGMHAAPNYLYLVIGSTLVKVHADGTTADTFPGVLVTNTGTVSMANNGTQILIVDGNAGYIFDAYNTAAGTLTKIADSDFPNGAQTCAFLGGFFIVEKPETGQFYVSASYDGTSWDGSMFATAEQNPDYLVAVDADRGFLGLFGTNTVEYWSLSGALDFPFAPNVAATQQWGLAARFSRAHIDNSVIFLAQNAKGEVQVMQIAGGYEPQRISTSDLEFLINNYTTVSDAVALSYLHNGHPFYQITFPTANQSWLYDCSNAAWSQVQTGVALTARHMGQYAAVFNGKTIVCDTTTTNLYNFDANTFTDNGTPIKRQLQTKHLSEDFNVISVDELLLEMETGVGLQTGQGSDPQCMLQISRDDGRTFGPERWAGFGKVGQYYTPRCVWRRLGSSRDFVYRWTVTDPVKFTVVAAYAVIRERAQ